jgi:L-fucose isomerase-like protein
MAFKQKQTFGILIGTRNYFNASLAEDVRTTILEVLDRLGYGYVILDKSATPTGSIETWEDAKNDKVSLDKRRDAFCGKLSVCNNLYQYQIPFTNTSTHTYSIHSQQFIDDLVFFAGVCRVVKGLRHARIGAIGARPAGFQTCRASEKILQESGITVVPVDLSEIISKAQHMDDQADAVKKQLEKIKAYAQVPAGLELKLALQAKFGLAVESWLEANEIDATAIQCWDSLEMNYGCAPCVSMSMMSERLLPSACEVDIAGAVSMYALMLASGNPSALLDWNNNFGEDRNQCVCTHCGNCAQRFVQNKLEVGSLGVLGTVLGQEQTVGAVKGKVREGDFTFFRISTDDTAGFIKSYLGKGVFTNDPYDMDGCIAVARINRLQTLLNYMCKQGFEHHVAMVRGDVVNILKEAVYTYLGWGLYVHDSEEDLF